MKTIHNILLILGLALSLTPLKLQAQATPNPPGQISYQGFLTDANGLPLATNNPINYNVTFRIFNASTGGTLLWAEQQVVTVDRGYFTVMLGNGSAISTYGHDLTTAFSGSDASDRYLEMTVQGLAPGDPAIAPRLRLLASPYSFLASKALNVDGSAVQTGTIGDTRLSSNVALRAGGNIFSGDQTFNAGDLFIDNTHAIWAKNNTGQNQIFFWPRYADNVTYMNYGSGGFNIRSDPGATTMFMDNSGNVGIGTASPAFPLSFANSTGDKLSLYGSGGGNYYGFGVASFQLQIHTDTSAADVVFGYGSQSTSFGETMRIKGTGQVGIGTTSPGKKLQVGDGGVAGSEGMIRLASRSSTGGAAGRTWDIGVPQTGDNTSGAGYSFVINDGGTTDFMVQFGSGNVGIGTTSPTDKLTVNGGTTMNGNLTMANGDWILAKNSAGTIENFLWPRWSDNATYLNFGTGGFYIRNNANSPTMYLNPTNSTVKMYSGLFLNGDLQLTHPSNNKTWDFNFESGTDNLVLYNPNGGYFVWYANGGGSISSDARLKKDISQLDDVLPRVLQLRPVSYHMRSEADSAPRSLGFIAQEVEQLFPELVSEHRGFKGVAYTEIIPVAIGAIQELNQKLEQKESDIKELKTRLEKLEQLLNQRSSTSQDR